VVRAESLEKKFMWMWPELGDFLSERLRQRGRRKIEEQTIVSFLLSDSIAWGRRITFVSEIS
jgi:hypothetical protein